MKAKTIRAILGGVLKKWWESIEDLEVRKLAVDNTIVTGGSIASMLLGEDVNDFDIYFRTMETAEKIAAYYVKRFKEGNKIADPKNTKPLDLCVQSEGGRVKIYVRSAGIISESSPEVRGESAYNYFETLPDGDILSEEYVKEVSKAKDDEALKEDEKKGKYRPVFLSSNAITLSGKIQLIIRFWGEPEEIHHNYDFCHCTSWYQSWDKTLHLPPKALECLLAKELRYSGSLYPICSMIRVRKFVARGWTITAGQILKMAFQISKLNLEDYTVLEEQLVGVDHAYFSQLLAKLKEKDSQKVDVGYLMEVIDSLF